MPRPAPAIPLRLRLFVPVAAAQIFLCTFHSFRRHSKTLKRFYYNNLSAYCTLVDLVVISVT